MTYEEFESDVIKAARAESGYDEIYVDEVRNYFYRDDFKGAVDHAINQTIYWSGDYMEDENTTESTLSDLVDEYIDSNNLHRLEGETGLNNLNKICQSIGYKGGYWAQGSPLESFLMDNSDAAQALVDWIKEQNFEEWRDSITSYLPTRDGA